jgi:hypothetical protein
VDRDLDVVPVGFIDDRGDLVVGDCLDIAPGGIGDLDQVDPTLALLAGFADELVACCTRRPAASAGVPSYTYGRVEDAHYARKVEIRFP